MKYQTIGCVADNTEIAQAVLIEFTQKLKFIDINQEKDLKGLDLIIVLGGDGFMLHNLHKYMELNIPFYGINCGSVGFLLNQFTKVDLKEKINNAVQTVTYPLSMTATKIDGTKRTRLGFNEVSLFREKYQAGHIKVSVNNNVYLERLICDGVLVATPAGSSAYNYSAGGSIIPLGSNIIALTPLNAFRPRRWQGALLPHDCVINFEVLDHKKRPMSATADFHEVRDVVNVKVKEERGKVIRLLFDPEHSLEERIIREQFAS